MVPMFKNARSSLKEHPDSLLSVIQLLIFWKLLLINHYFMTTFLNDIILLIFHQMMRDVIYSIY